MTCFAGTGNILAKRYPLHKALEQGEIICGSRQQWYLEAAAFGDVKVGSVQVWKSEQRYGVTRTLKAMIRRVCQQTDHWTHEDL
jgi:hypothetical protein